MFTTSINQYWQSFKLFAAFAITCFTALATLSSYAHTSPRISLNQGTGLAIQNDGTALVWGDGSRGQLGDGTSGTDVFRAAPGVLEPFSYVAVAAGRLHHLALYKTPFGSRTYEIFAWGDNSFGQLGLAPDNNGVEYKESLYPSLVKQFGGSSPVVAIATSHAGNSSYALTADGTVWAWGENSSGQLGDGTNTNRFAPTQVLGVTNAKAIAAGFEFAAALLADGTVVTWGSNSNGQLGNGTTVSNNTRVVVPGLTNVVQIAPGGSHMLALKSDGTVAAWGNNALGQLCNGTTTNRSSPAVVAGLSGVIQAASNAATSHFLRADQSVAGCGDNSSGQLADGTFVNKSVLTPSNLNAGSGVTSLVAGGNKVAAIRLTDVKVTGAGDFGGLGNGGLVNVNSFTAMLGVGANGYLNLWKPLINFTGATAGQRLEADDQRKLGTSVYADYYPILLTAGQVFTVSMKGNFNSGNSNDTYLALYGPDGKTQVAFDNDSGPGQSSRLTYTAVASGTHYLAASAFSPFVSGSYSLYVSQTQSDLSGDGKSDIVFRNSDTGDIETWIMDGSTRTYFTYYYSRYFPNTSISHVADFDGDGKADLMFQKNDGAVILMLQEGFSSSSYGFAIAGANDTWRVAQVADFNGDGKADILWRNQIDGSVAMWLMDGLNLIGTALLTGPGPWMPTLTGDFNDDGRADIVWRNSNDGSTALWLMNGTNFVSGAGLVGASTWVPTHAADFNGDGKADIVWRNSSDGSTALWLMNGATLTSGTILSGAGPWTINQVADFNGDRKADILWRNNSDTSHAIWLMNGTAFASGAIIRGPSSYVPAQIGDHNGDGKADIIWRNTTDGSIVLWLMNGATMTSSALLLDAGPWRTVP